MLQIPYALGQSGWFGLALLLLSAWVNHYTGRLIAKCLYTPEKRLSGYPDIGQEAFGPWGYTAVQIMYNAALLGTTCLYLILSGMNLSEMLPWLNAKSWTMLCAFLLFIPFAFKRTLKEVGIASISGALASIIIVGIVIIMAWIDYPTHDTHHDWLKWEAFGSVLGTFAFSYGGNYIYPEVEGEMERPQDFGQVLTWSMTLITGLYVAAGVS